MLLFLLFVLLAVCCFCYCFLGRRPLKNQPLRQDVCTVFLVVYAAFAVALLLLVLFFRLLLGRLPLNPTLAAFDLPKCHEKLQLLRAFVTSEKSHEQIHCIRKCNNTFLSEPCSSQCGSVGVSV